MNALRLLVSARGAAFPAREPEWQSYLDLLEQHARPDGLLPAQFDGLVWDVFEPLL